MSEMSQLHETNDYDFNLSVLPLLEWNLDGESMSLNAPTQMTSPGHASNVVTGNEGIGESEADDEDNTRSNAELIKDTETTDRGHEVATPDLSREDLESRSSAAISTSDLGIQWDLKVSVEKRNAWLHKIVVEYIHDDNSIGHCLAYYINRYAIDISKVGKFWERIEYSDQFSILGPDIFDGDGKFRKCYYKDPIQRGTGAWGKIELNRGPLLFIERLRVTAREFRGTGLERAIVHKIIDLAHAVTSWEGKGAFQDQNRFYDQKSLTMVPRRFRQITDLNVLFVPVSHQIDYEDLRGKSRQEQYEIGLGLRELVEAFWRSLGFRRIGVSRCFGLSFDPNHASRRMPMESDCDGLAHPRMDEHSREKDKHSLWAWLLSPERKRQMEQDFIFHYLTAISTERQYLEFYKDLINRESVANQLGDNLLHIAARSLNLRCIRWLLENYNQAQNLTSARNKGGGTPFEVLKANLEGIRNRKDQNGNCQFVGYLFEEVDCIIAFKGIKKLPRTDIQYHRLTYGCTCGECVEGYISPLMKAALLYECDEIEKRSHSYAEYGFPDNMLLHIPSSVQIIQRSVPSRRSFLALLKAVAFWLRQPINPAPRRKIVISRFTSDGGQWDRDPDIAPEKWVTLAGATDAALAFIFALAKHHDSRIGDGSFEASAPDIANLKPCRNDHEFDFVERVRVFRDDEEEKAAM
ncbi:uncharacterized protein LY89DRAFT_750798 [Mollisia scopiformis]|uniref:Uncharacterized protein n=1 Tax=Mollisia scopiformis TaxID=149040 RepID=A0A194X5I9_MOLSC|nr:uncharacterized protein LY89DRAFT_750798 [Mollisia scopiformis]KUJ15448.1 hypothetical protein LY89DRAFT_750798 [Mollisia scopiformis]